MVLTFAFRFWVAETQPMTVREHRNQGAVLREENKHVLKNRGWLCGSCLPALGFAPVFDQARLQGKHTRPYFYACFLSPYATNLNALGCPADFLG